MTTTILFALFDPKKIIIVNFIPMPAIMFAVFSVGYELLGLRWNDGVSHIGHLGGAAYAIIYFFVRGRRFRGYY